MATAAVEMTAAAGMAAVAAVAVEMAARMATVAVEMAADNHMEYSDILWWIG